MSAPDALHFAACIERARESGYPHFAQALADLYLSLSASGNVPPSGICGLTASGMAEQNPSTD